MVKLELNLPWKPVLAWPWGVSYLIDPDTFLVTKHTESWDIEPWKVSKEVFTFQLSVGGMQNAFRYRLRFFTFYSRVFSRFSVILLSKWTIN